MKVVKKYGWTDPMMKKGISTDKVEKQTNLPKNIDKLGNSFRMSKKYVPNEHMLDGYQSMLLFKK